MTLFRILVLALFVPLTASASLLVGPATPLTPPAERVGAYRPQNFPSVAWNGETGMAVWRTRVGQRDFVLVNHVDANGKPLEAAPLVVWSEGQTLFARVVPVGERFLVVWQSFGPIEGAMRVAIVEADGTIVQRGSVATRPFWANDVASNGTTVVITGNSGEPGYEAELLWLDANGNLFSRKSFGSMLMLSTLVRPSGSSFLIAAQRMECEVYTCGHQFLLARAEADGTMSEPKVIRAIEQTSNSDYRLEAFAVAQDRFLTVFHEPFGLMTGMLFELDGDTLSGPFPLEDAGASGVPVSAASDGTAFAVVYPHVIYDNPLQPVSSTRLRRVSTNGASEPELLTQTPSIAALEWTGNGYLLARSSDFPGVTATRLSSNGQPVAVAPVHVLSHAPNQQEAPDAIWDGTQLFTVWEEFQPLTGLWQVKYGTGTPISDSTASQRNARIVFDGSRYLVLWSETTPQNATEIRARRLNGDGSFAGNAFLVAATPTCSSAFNAASVGNRVLVAHVGGGCEPYAKRSVLVTPVESNDSVSAATVIVDDILPDTPVISSTGTTALVAWSEGVPRAASDPCPWIYEYCPPKTVLRGAILDGASVSRVSLAEGSLMVNRDPELAWNGETFLVVWLAATDLQAVPELRTRLFWSNGAPASNAFVLAGDASFSYQGEPRGSAVATANGSYLVTWRRGSFMNSLSVWRVAKNGVPVDVVEREIEHEATDLRTPRLVRGPGSSSFLLYSLSGPDTIYLGHNRIVSRSIVETIRARAVRH